MSFQYQNSRVGALNLREAIAVEKVSCVEKGKMSRLFARVVSPMNRGSQTCTITFYYRLLFFTQFRVL
jgi:hypothetical protein